MRKLIAAVLGTVATFVMLFGAGMTSWAIVALGGALLVLAIGLVAVTAVRTGSRAWVTGSAHVHQVSEPPAAYAFGRCELQIVIDAPGLPARSVKVIDPRVPVAKWPVVGQQLPIKVAIDDQRHVRILWDEAPTHAESAARPIDLTDLGGLDGLDDDLLIQRDAPPWLRRDPDDDYPPAGPGDPVTADLTEELSGLRGDPVVVRQGPGGTIVLEGTLVEPAPAVAAPLPRRPRPGPTADPQRAEPPSTEEPLAEEPSPVHSRESEPVEPADARVDRPSTGHSVPRPSPPPDDIDLDLDLAVDEPVAGQRLEPDRAESTPTTAPADQPLGAGPISGVGITLLVTELDRSVRFYRDLLGFHEIDSGRGNAVLASGATRLVLRLIPDVAPINRRVVHLNLEVADIDSAYQELRRRGLSFTSSPRAVNRGEKMELWAAAFRDPDGHGIALTQWRDRPAADPTAGGVSAG